MGPDSDGAARAGVDVSRVQAAAAESRRAACTAKPTRRALRAGGSSSAGEDFAHRSIQLQLISRLCRETALLVTKRNGHQIAEAKLVVDPRDARELRHQPLISCGCIPATVTAVRGCGVVTAIAAPLAKSRFWECFSRRTRPLRRIANAKIDDCVTKVSRFGKSHDASSHFSAHLGQQTSHLALRVTPALTATCDISLDA